MTEPSPAPDPLIGRTLRGCEIQEAIGVSQTGSVTGLTTVTWEAEVSAQTKLLLSSKPMPGDHPEGSRR